MDTPAALRFKHDSPAKTGRAAAPPPSRAAARYRELSPCLGDARGAKLAPRNEDGSGWHRAAARCQPLRSVLATERALRGQARPARHIPCPQRDRVPARAAETLSRKPASRVRTARTRRDASGEAAPMLSRPGPLPSGSGWSFELNWDGFRAIVSTEDQLRVRSRRGWNMTTALPELRGLPGGLVLDGELVAWKGSEPYFPHVCACSTGTCRSTHVRCLRLAPARRD